MEWKAESTLRGIELACHLFASQATALRPGLADEAASLVCEAFVEGVMNAPARHAPERIIDGSVVDELIGMLLRYLTTR